MLPAVDLKVVVLVCRRWREVGEAPGLWTWVNIPPVEAENLAVMTEMVESRRLHGTERLVLKAVSEEMCEAMVSNPGLRVLNIGANISCVSPVLLARTLSQMEEVDLGRSSLACAQASALATALAQGVRLKRLNLFQCDVSSVVPELLARAVTNLEEVTLWHSRLTTQQVEAVFRALASSSALRRLDISYNNLSSVEAGVLGQAVARLEMADMGSTSLTGNQVTSILTAVLRSSCLTSLWISGVQGEVDRQLVQQAGRLVPQLRVG